MTSTGEAAPQPQVEATIVAPCRNEAGHIEAFLDGVERLFRRTPGMECILVDGASDDGTIERFHAWQASRSLAVRMVPNSFRDTPHALNIGIRQARGRVIVRMDVHSTYPDDYVERLLDALVRHPDAGNVGGVWDVVPSGDGCFPRAIADVTSSRWGMGGVDYRLGEGEEREVDTVPFGCFPRSVFDEVGFFDEDMLRNQDDEFNLRLRRGGRKIILLPNLVIRYHARPRLGQLARMFWQYGLFKPLVWLKNGTPATTRQFAPPAMVLGFGGSLLLAPWLPCARACVAAVWVLYLGLGCLVAREKGWRSWASMLSNAWVLFVVHLSYGSGYLAGLVRFSLFRRSVPRLTPTR